MIERPTRDADRVDAFSKGMYVDVEGTRLAPTHVCLTCNAHRNIHTPITETYKPSQEDGNPLSIS